MTTSQLPRMMTVPEVQEYLRLDTDKGVMRLIRSGELPATKLNLRWLIAETDLLALIESRKTRARKELI
jgi:excisionase family DNA binding protein